MIDTKSDNQMCKNEEFNAKHGTNNYVICKSMQDRNYPCSNYNIQFLILLYIRVYRCFSLF